MQKKQYDYMIKLILVGYSSVGKSNILLRYTRNEFSQNSQTTIGVQYATKTIQTPKGKKIKFQIWDTAGQQRYKCLMRTFYKGASAALIVYDITNEKSFVEVDNEIKAIKQYLKGDIITMIVGNKTDLEDQREVTKQRGLEIAENRKIAFYEVSAKEGTNIDLIFSRIGEQIEKIMERSQKPENNKEEHSQQIKQVKPKTNIRLSKEQAKRQQQPGSKKSCCK